MRFLFLQLILFTFIANGTSQEILPLKSRADIIDKIQKDRLDNLLPKLMIKSNLDMWVIITREYNEDPIIKTMLPATWLNARRTTIIVFSLDQKTKEFESVAIARYAFGENIPSIWNKEEQPNQWQALSDYIISKNPENIGINTSSYESLADGLSKYHYDQLYNVLPSKFQKRLTSAEDLSIAWIETRTELEMTVYSQLGEKDAAVVSFTHPSIHPEDFARLLDAQGIAVRTGHHCAQPLMERLGVSGTIRASFYIYNDEDDANTFLNGIDRVLEAMA